MHLWTDLIHDYVGAMVDRYGLEEVENWVFVLYNEPGGINAYSTQWQTAGFSYYDMSVPPPPPPPTPFCACQACAGGRGSGRLSVTTPLGQVLQHLCSDQIALEEDHVWRAFRLDGPGRDPHEPQV